MSLRRPPSHPLEQVKLGLVTLPRLALPDQFFTRASLQVSWERAENMPRLAGLCPVFLRNSLGKGM